MITAPDLEAYLHRHIPLSAAMGVGVVTADPAGVVLSAPLAPNINHRDTAFGGSVASLATLAAWGAIYVGLAGEGLAARIVVQRSAMRYERPAAEDFEAVAGLDDAAAWGRFVTLLRRRGRARLGVEAEVRCQGRVVGHFDGQFAALTDNE